MAKRSSNQRRQSKPDKPWRITERVVAALEQAIAPNARVAHDVKLLDYETNRQRQCDVVIFQGAHPRETITIVEVQRRNRKVGIEQFEAWCRKREKLRAQHLICVSKKGFTAGVVEDAKRLGNVVRLIELKDLEQGIWPVKFKDGKLTLYWGSPKLERYLLSTVDNKTPSEHFTRGEVSFTRNGTPTEIGTIFLENFPTIQLPTAVGQFEGEQRIYFSEGDEVIMTWKEGAAQVTAIAGIYSVDMQTVDFSMSALEYKLYD